MKIASIKTNYPNLNLVSGTQNNKSMNKNNNPAFRAVTLDVKDMQKMGNALYDLGGPRCLNQFQMLLTMASERLQKSFSQDAIIRVIFQDTPKDKIVFNVHACREGISKSSDTFSFSRGERVTDKPYDVVGADDDDAGTKVLNGFIAALMQAQERMLAPYEQLEKSMRDLVSKINTPAL